MGVLLDFKHFKDFLRKYVPFVSKDDLDHFGLPDMDPFVRARRSRTIMSRIRDTSLYEGPATRWNIFSLVPTKPIDIKQENA